MEIKLKDNSKHFLPTQSIPPCLGNISNVPIDTLVSKDKDSSLLIWPSSLKLCEEDIYTQSILQTFQTDETTTQVLTGNLAGFIGVGDDVQISIRSRFNTNGDKDLFLHYLLQKSGRINLFNLKHNTNNADGLDFLFFLFPQVLNAALSQGIFRSYQSFQHNDTRVKGCIDFNRHIKKNIPFNGLIAYNTREFSSDNQITQLIRHTIEYISHKNLGMEILQSDAETKSNVQTIIQSTPTYQSQQRRHIINKNIKPIQHPYFTKYTALQKLCLMILRHDSLKYGENSQKIYGVLFDVAWMWENYLSSLLRTIGFIHTDNIKGIGGKYLTTDNNFIRYPDFYKGNIIVDAKYKNQIDTRNDINQIVTYLYLFKGKCGIFILPKEQDPSDSRHVFIESNHPLKGYGLDNDARIKIIRCQIPNNIQDSKTFVKEMELMEKELKDLLNKI